MNKKIGMIFLGVVLMVGHSYSQEALAPQTDDSIEHFESTPSDQLYMQENTQGDGQENPGEYEPTDDDLKKIAEREANNDLVNFADILDTKTSVPAFDQSPLADKKDEEAFEGLDVAGIEGIDTVDLDQPQGNWLFKRIWWERSEQSYEKIKKKIEEIFEHRMIFFEKRAELVKNILDPFYLKIGMGQGEFQAILEDYIQRLEAEREKKGSLTAQEREMLTKLDNEREALEQLVVDVQAIGEVENRVDESLSRLLQQLSAIRAYDKQAWDAFKEIARVVDDEKARQLYSAVDTAARNIKDIGDYLEHAFAAHFDQLIATAKEQTERVTVLVAGLKEKGIDLKKRVEQLIGQQSSPKATQEKQIEKEEESEEEQGFVSSYILSPLSAAWNGVVSVVTWPYYALVGAADDESSGEEE